MRRCGSGGYIWITLRKNNMFANVFAFAAVLERTAGYVCAREVSCFLSLRCFVMASFLAPC